MNPSIYKPKSVLIRPHFTINRAATDSIGSASLQTQDDACDLYWRPSLFLHLRREWSSGVSSKDQVRHYYPPDARSRFPTFWISRGLATATPQPFLPLTSMRPINIHSFLLSIELMSGAGKFDP